MGIRKIQLFTGGIFHIYSRSIAEYKIFNSMVDFFRMKDILTYFREKKPTCFSEFSRFPNEKQQEILLFAGEKYVDIIAYCIMPTHIHLILSQIADNGISKFMEKVLKSYSLYFNKKFKRKGPLWSGKFSNVLVENDEQLIHLTRYIHLNPVSAYLVEKPEDWKFSSYNEYLGKTNEKLCNWENYLEINPDEYKDFVEERIDYQRELQEIKHLLLEE